MRDFLSVQHSTVLTLDVRTRDVKQGSRENYNNVEPNDLRAEEVLYCLVGLAQGASRFLAFF